MVCLRSWALLLELFLLLVAVVSFTFWIDDWMAGIWMGSLLLLLAMWVSR